MIIDLQRFIAAERPSWSELEKKLDAIEAEPAHRMSLEEVRRFHHLYQRAAADLARLSTFASEPDLRRYLENLVARAYGEVHEVRERRRTVHPINWFFVILPQTFRRHVRAFWLSVAITLAGCVFGGFALALDPDAKAVLMPFPHLQQDPAKRVAQEEHAARDRLTGHKTTFSAQLMTHNTRVSIFTMAMGVTWGLGTILLLFYNGVILGAVAVDYVSAGQTPFLLGWLLPHGAIEIPAILIAGQAGFILASALVGWGKPLNLRTRLRKVSRDLVTLIFGVALLLVWAGFVESFLSQYHEPVLPYWVKISFGFVEIILLTLFLARSGAGAAAQQPERNSPPQ